VKKRPGTLKEAIDNLFVEATEEEEIYVPENDEWVRDGSEIFTLRSENPRVKSCLYDREKNSQELGGLEYDDARNEYSCKYTTELVSDLIQLHEMIGEVVEMQFKEQFPLRLVSKDQEGRKTVTFLAPRIEGR